MVRAMTAIMLGILLVAPAAAAPHASESERYERGWDQLKKIDGEVGERVIEGLRGISPDLGRYIIEYVFGDVYPRPGLDIKTKELSVVAALTALGTATPQLKVHLNAALNVGCSPTEIGETILQMSVYSGFPSAINGMATFKDVLAERKAKGIKDNEGAAIQAVPMQANREARGARTLSKLDPEQTERLRAQFGDLAPDLTRFILEFAYGDIVSRPGLSLAQREIITIAALTVLGTAPSQLRFHINGGLNAGLTAENIREVMILMSAYAGFPAAINGTQALKDVLAERAPD